MEHSTRLKDPESAAALFAAGVELEPAEAARLVLAIACQQRALADFRDDYPNIVRWREMVEIASAALHGATVDDKAGARVVPADPEKLSWWRRVLLPGRTT